MKLLILGDEFTVDNTKQAASQCPGLFGHIFTNLGTSGNDL